MEEISEHRKKNKTEQTYTHTNKQGSQENSTIRWLSTIEPCTKCTLSLKLSMLQIVFVISKWSILISLIASWMHGTLDAESHFAFCYLTEEHEDREKKI